MQLSRHVPILKYLFVISALHAELSPIQVAFFIESESSNEKDLKDLKTFLTELSFEEEIEVSDDNVETFDDADNLGIPFTVVIKDNVIRHIFTTNVMININPFFIFRVWKMESCICGIEKVAG